MKQSPDNKNSPFQRLESLSTTLVVTGSLALGLLISLFVAYYLNFPAPLPTSTSSTIIPAKQVTVFWRPKPLNEIYDSALTKQILYGKELISHTAIYLGPKGKVARLSNGMNCQNCHLDAGTKIWGNNFGSVAANYPKYRARSGSVESIFKRVNDCFERSLNGKALDSTSKELLAIKAYIEYVGSNVEKGQKAVGSGFKDLEYLDRAANPDGGKKVYTEKCRSCHQSHGQGLANADSTEFTYPPLWGPASYNDGAGLYRISNLARFVKNNMPWGADFEHPQLSNEDAWDVAAFINSQPHPHKLVPADWPDKSKMPIDHPFGPYADSFSEQQHKFGPWKPIMEEKARLGKPHSHPSK